MNTDKKTFFDKISSQILYRLGFAGLFPNLGLITGGILLFHGFKRKDLKMKIIGIASILFTPLFWLLLENSELHKKQLIELTKYQLNEVVKDLEFYKSKNGQYPDSLAELKPQNKFFNDEELFINEFDFTKSKLVRFYYKKVENDYILKSSGPDLILGTKDDIYSQLKK
ncbi:hypothetical protein [Flavobacterium sp. KACC 22761]|uniref:hypothetical protein n=1 Tax=Flavobacterium sp. KACC 22761 TaxID=3092665 RepID=UPI002A74C302|nr:hypothetical protein [Flavobacterium sp. KACC 22761]WPO80282.1 hypothetical protein SCB73_07825 [Flavobacterium sp. KACC 22761]